MRICTFIFVFTILFSSCERMPDDSMDPNETKLVNYFPPITGSSWASSDPDSLGWNTSNLEGLYNYLESKDTRAFIILVDGKIVVEKYFGKTIIGIGDFNESSDWYWASAGKTLTGFTVGKAQEDGYLSLDEPSRTYLGKNWTSLTDSQEEKITVWNHLTMTTGLNDGVPKSGSTDPEDLQYLADAGKRWAYHNAPYTILESVVSNAVSENFDDYFDRVLKDPIGMDGTWTWVDENHVFFSTARSMARFGLLIQNKGIWDETTIMSDSTFINSSVSPSQNINNSYGYLWWLNGQSSFMLPQSQIVFSGSLIKNAPDDMYSAIGKNSQILSVIPSKKMVLVRMGGDPDVSAVPTEFLNELWTYLNDILE